MMLGLSLIIIVTAISIIGLISVLATIEAMK